MSNNKSNLLQKRIELLKNSSILSLPSFFGIMLALAAIPIHLQTNGKSDYGNYIFFHFILSFSLLLNFGINKISAIEIAKKKNVNQIITQSLKTSLKIVSIILLFLLITIVFIDNSDFFLFSLIGLSLTIIYLTFDGILQGLKNFKLLSIANFIFYTLSLNVPSITLLYINNYNFLDLIKISLILKFLTLIIIGLCLKKYFYYKVPLKKYNFNVRLIKYSKWYFLHFLNIQIYDFLDKYLIKVFMGPLSLAIYSIPYQVAGKISILSKSIAAVLLPEVSYNKEKISFNYSIKFFGIIMPSILLFIFPYLSWLLNFWLKSQYTHEILNLTKIFLIIAWISGMSHLLISYFEGKKKIKYNTTVELYFIIPFLLMLLFVLLKYNNLIYVSFVLLIKETILFILRIEKIKNNIESINAIYINIFLVLINLTVSLYLNKYFLITLIILVIYNSKLIIENFKK